MKEFISGTAMLLLLLIFPLQAQTDTLSAYKINNLNEIVFNAAEQARFDGYFTNDNITDTKNKIAQVFNIEPSEVIINATTTPKFRSNEYDERERIEYEIIVPFKGIFASSQFLGLSDEINNKNIVKKGYIFSEVLP